MEQLEIIQSKYMPFAFTELGVANREIMRAFVARKSNK